MFALNPNAPEFVPARIVEANGQPACVFYQKEENFDRDFVDDRDLFNPVVFPVSQQEHDELEATEAFNMEMARLEELESHQELHELLQDRIKETRHGIPRPAKVLTTTLGGDWMDSNKPAYHSGARRADIKNTEYLSKARGKPAVTKCRQVQQPTSYRR